MEEPLTPSHLLLGRRVLSLPDHLGYLCDLEDEEFAVDPVQLTRRVRYLNNTLNHFWDRWRTEYLNELREAHGRYMSKTSQKPSYLSTGDIIIVHSEKLPRGLWKLGKIQEFLLGRDGHTRAAVVKTTANDGRSVLLRRPVQLLYSMELRGHSGTSADEVSQAEDDHGTSLEKDTIPISGRPKRAAALRGEDRRKACMYV